MPRRAWLPVWKELDGNLRDQFLGAISSGTDLRDQIRLPVRRLTGYFDVPASLFEACDTRTRCLVIVKLNSGDIVEFWCGYMREIGNL